MSKMPINRIKSFKKLKKNMSLEQKKRLLVGLKKLKEEYTGNVGGETDIRNADNLQVSEDAYTTQEEPNKTVIAKTFETNADLDSYVAQRRGIEMTPKEQAAISNYRHAKPLQQDRFFVKYEDTDEFGNNTTTYIKKLNQDGQFCWTAFSTHEMAEQEGKPKEPEEPEMPEKNPEGEEGEKGEMGGSEEPKTKSNGEPEIELKEQEDLSKPNEMEEDSIRITKTTTFVDEMQGATILADFLQQLDL